MLWILCSALILSALIKVFTDDETSLMTVALGSVGASFVTNLLVGIACSPIESILLKYIISLVIYFIITAIMIQMLCSTDLKGLLSITGIYIGIILVLQIIVQLCMG